MNDWFGAENRENVGAGSEDMLVEGPQVYAQIR
jgi:hypothetical protein